MTTHRLTTDYAKNYYNRFSEWVSSFLTALQHKIQKTVFTDRHCGMFCMLVNIYLGSGYRAAFVSTLSKQLICSTSSVSSFFTALPHRSYQLRSIYVQWWVTPWGAILRQVDPVGVTAICGMLMDMTDSHKMAFQSHTCHTCSAKLKL